MDKKNKSDTAVYYTNTSLTTTLTQTDVDADTENFFSDVKF